MNGNQLSGQEGRLAPAHSSGDRTMSCLFCGIVSKEVDASIIFEDDISLVFLDHRPLFPGHCLLVPKSHFKTLTDLPTELVGLLFTNVQLLTRAVELALEAEGSFVAMNNRVSQSVPHLHIHIVPRRKKDGLKGFFWPRNKYESTAHLAEVQASIKGAIAEIQKHS
jgi:histidine triad (HIT) family protein